MSRLDAAKSQKEIASEFYEDFKRFLENSTSRMEARYGSDAAFVAALNVLAVMLDSILGMAANKNAAFVRTEAEQIKEIVDDIVSKKLAQKLDERTREIRDR